MMIGEDISIFYLIFGFPIVMFYNFHFRDGVK